MCACFTWMEFYQIDGALMKLRVIFSTSCVTRFIMLAIGTIFIKCSLMWTSIMNQDGTDGGLDWCETIAAVRGGSYLQWQLCCCCFSLLSSRSLLHFLIFGLLKMQRSSFWVFTLVYCCLSLVIYLYMYVSLIKLGLIWISNHTPQMKFIHGVCNQVIILVWWIDVQEKTQNRKTWSTTCTSRNVQTHK